jgi:preprotein translocase SecE subunit
MTAVALCLLTLSAAAWAASELQALRLPTPRWAMGLTGVQGVPAAEQSVKLQRVEDGENVTIGTAVVEQVSVTPSGAGSMRVKTVAITAPGKTMQDVTRVENADGGPGGAAAFSATVARPEGIPIVDRLTLQIVVAGLLAAGGLFGAWYLTAVKHASVDFLIATDGEMKKVNWSTRKVILDSTSVVIAATFLIAICIFVFDTALHKIMSWIGIF